MRRRRPEKRKILPDPIFSDLEVAKFMNFLMIGGKKGASEKIFYGAIQIVKSRTKKDGIDISLIKFKRPTQLEVKSKRFGGATYQVPVEVKS